jgi:hypothetical protein
VDNIRMDLGEVGWGGEDWIESGSGLRQEESSCECGNEPSGAIKCWETTERYRTGGLSSSAQLHRASFVQKYSKILVNLVTVDADGVIVIYIVSSSLLISLDFPFICLLSFSF